jgi:hypothetical protein
VVTLSRCNVFRPQILTAEGEYPASEEIYLACRVDFNAQLPAPATSPSRSAGDATIPDRGVVVPNNFPKTLEFNTSDYVARTSSDNASKGVLKSNGSQAKASS